MISTPYFDDLQKVANSYYSYDFVKRNWLMCVVGFSDCERTKMRTKQLTLKERFVNTGINTTKIAKMIEVVPISITNYLNNWEGLTKHEQGKLHRIICKYENM